MDDRTRGTTDASTETGLAGVLLRARPGEPAEALATIRRALVLGRGDTGDVVLPGAHVSRTHARVWTSGGRFHVEDLRSHNGTHVNGRRITSPQELHDGDLLRLGDVELLFRLVRDDVTPPIPRQPTVTAPSEQRNGSGPLPSEQPTPSPGTGDGGVGAKPVALAVLESLVGTALSQALDTGKVGAFVLAVITPLVATAFTLRRDGKVRIGAVAIVTAIAFVMTFVGVTAADFALGRSVIPWSDSGRTFVPVPDEGTPTAPKVTMPKLVGYDNVSAMQLLMRAGFDPRNVLMLRTKSSRDSFGKVVRTDPPAGRAVPRDAIVRVYIGTGS